MDSATEESKRPYIVVAAVGDGPSALKVIETAAANLGNRAGGELHILHAAPPAPVVSETTVALLEHGRKCLDQAAQGQGESAHGRVFVHIRSGTPWQETLSEAERLHADLVVVGMHERSGLARFFGTDTSQGEEVLRHAACPVLVVHEPSPSDDVAPEIEPPCPDCLLTRMESDGATEWCPEHARPHVKAHVLYEMPEGFGAGSMLLRP